MEHGNVCAVGGRALFGVTAIVALFRGMGTGKIH